MLVLSVCAIQTFEEIFSNNIVKSIKFVFPKKYSDYSRSTERCSLDLFRSPNNLVKNSSFIGPSFLTSTFKWSRLHGDSYYADTYIVCRYLYSIANFSIVSLNLQSSQSFELHSRTETIINVCTLNLHR